MGKVGGSSYRTLVLSGPIGGPLHRKGDPLFREPGPCLHQLTSWEEFNWSAAEAGTREGKSLRLPLRIAHNRDLGDLMASCELKVEVVPIRAAFPAGKILEDGEDPWLLTRVDLKGEGVLPFAEL